MTFPTFDKLSTKSNRDKFKQANQTMSFPEYLELTLNRPTLAFSAYQRFYSMIVSAGFSKYEKYRKTHTRFHFFDDTSIPVFGLNETLESIVKHARGAAYYHGPERRILLLHGPVGSAKSTICRRLKRGLENYSLLDEGAVYTYDWVGLEKAELEIKDKMNCPLNDDPLKLLQPEMRSDMVADLQKRLNYLVEEKGGESFPLRLYGDLNPRCNYYMKELMKQYDGDWSKVVTNHVRVRRIVLSESNRCGIGTFQPKDPKNQDATELTGDVDYLKLAYYGTDSDPRSFSFDGEFQISNRGMLEFIEVLKLEKEFLYDLLGVCQERQIKPKKFPQMDVDMVLIGHSVKNDTPIPHEYDGILDIQTIEELSTLDFNRIRVFSLNEETRKVELTKIHNIFSHSFEGDWVSSHQSGDVLTTTPNHSVYNEDYKTFYPGDDDSTPILELTIPGEMINGKPVTQEWLNFFAGNEEIVKNSNGQLVKWENKVA